MTRFTSTLTSLALATLLTCSPAFADGIVTAFGTSVLVASGSPPTLSGTCTTSTQVGGQAAGSFHATCTSQTVIMTFATTAPNGWACVASDQTTPADKLNQTASTTTTATLTGTTAAADTVSFMCMAY